MSFEYFTAMAVDEEEQIDQVVRAEGRYAVLMNAPWQMKARILATGLHEKFAAFVKDGRREDNKKGIKEIRGYPGIMKSAQTDDSTGLIKYFLPDPEVVISLPAGSCLLKFKLKLTTPFYSRDDIVFYPTDNVLRRDWVFGMPCLGASGVKGLLRWAWKMSGVSEQAADRDMETTLFGSSGDERRADDEGARKGCLYSYPLFWEGRIGLEVINPHDRKTGTGTNPIKYEVVLSGGESVLYMLTVNRSACLDDAQKMLAALESPISILLDHSGLSAKRSVGWGNVVIESCAAFVKAPKGIFREAGKPKAVDPWMSVTDAAGNLKPIEDTAFFSTDRLSEFTGISKSQIKKNEETKKQAREKILSMWEEEKKRRLHAYVSDDSQANVIPFIAKEISAKDIPGLFQELKSKLSGIQSGPEGGD